MHKDKEKKTEELQKVLIEGDLNKANIIFEKQIDLKALSDQKV